MYMGGGEAVTPGEGSDGSSLEGNNTKAYYLPFKLGYDVTT